MLQIENLSCEIENKAILRKFCLTVPKGEVHAIMGPNGAGKSTLAKVLAGHPSCQVTEGNVWFKGQNLLEMEPEERVHAGLFMSFQYPMEIAGVSNLHFLFTAVNRLRKHKNQEALSKEEFEKSLDLAMQGLQMKQEFKERGINEGFSGGEKKKGEILQMTLLQPDCMILDETDSGLDIDAMRVVADGVNALRSPERAIVLITHYQRLLHYISPDRVHVLVDGQIIKTGPASLALELEEKGYA